MVHLSSVSVYLPFFQQALRYHIHLCHLHPVHQGFSKFLYIYLGLEMNFHIFITAFICIVYTYTYFSFFTKENDEKDVHPYRFSTWTKRSDHTLWSWFSWFSLKRHRGSFIFLKSHDLKVSQALLLFLFSDTCMCSQSASKGNRHS